MERVYCRSKTLKSIGTLKDVCVHCIKITWINVGIVLITPLFFQNRKQFHFTKMATSDYHGKPLPWLCYFKKPKAKPVALSKNSFSRCYCLLTCKKLFLFVGCCCLVGWLVLFVWFPVRVDFSPLQFYFTTLAVNLALRFCKLELAWRRQTGI